MRKQFTFFESFASAINRIKSKSARAEAYDAIVNYALYGKEPNLDKMADSAAITFDLIKPVLDKSKRRADAGSEGGKAKQTESKTEANDNQTTTKQEAIYLDDKGDGLRSNDLRKPPTDVGGKRSPAVAAVVSDFLDRVNPAASQKCLEELTAYAESMGEAVCRRAIDIALDAKKANWPYIRAILRDKQAKGVKSLSDWDAAEAGRATTKGNQPGQDVGASKERIRKNGDWLDEFLASQEAAQCES